MNGSSPQVLFIHPIYTFLSNQVPMGVAGIMNALPPDVGRLGLYSNEVTAEHIAEAKILAIDVHWYPPLWPVQRLVESYKAINRNLRIILGGYTATVYAELLSQLDAVDFVIHGDAERPFVQLTEGILSGASVDDLADTANVVCNGKTSSSRYVMTSEEFNQLDYSDYSWFPTLLDRIARVHKGDFFQFDCNSYLPFLPISRGCPYPCEYCYGSPRKAHAIFGTTMRLRSAEATIRDLTRLSDSRATPSVFIVGDGVDLMGPDWTRQVFDRPYDLNLYFEFFNLPTVEQLRHIASAFNKCRFTFGLYRNHGELDRMADTDLLRELMAEISRQPNVVGEIWNARSYYAAPLVSADAPIYPVYSTEEWHEPAPTPGIRGRAQEEEYRVFEGRSLSLWEFTHNRPFLSLVTGLGMPLPFVAKPQLDPHLESLEFEKRNRGCLAYAVLDSGGVAEDAAEWLAGVTARGTRICRFEPNFDGDLTGFGEPHMLQLCVANPGSAYVLPRGMVHCNMEICEEGDLLAPFRFDAQQSGFETGEREKGHEINRSWWLIDPTRSAAATLGQLMTDLESQGRLIFDYPFQYCLADSCRFAADRCPARRLSRLIINEDRMIRPCFRGSIIGSVGDQGFDLLQTVHRRVAEIEKERGCSECSALGNCPQCLYTAPYSTEEYCHLIREVPAVRRTMRLYYSLARIRPPVPQSSSRHWRGKGVVESSQEHLLLRAEVRHAEEGYRPSEELRALLPDRKGSSRLGLQYRLAFFGKKPVLIDLTPDRDGNTTITRGALPVLRAIEQGELATVFDPDGALARRFGLASLNDYIARHGLLAD